MGGTTLCYLCLHKLYQLEESAQEPNHLVKLLVEISLEIKCPMCSLLSNHPNLEGVLSQVRICTCIHTLSVYVFAVHLTKTASVTCFIAFLLQPSVNEFSISVCNIDHFLMHKQFDKELLNFETRMMKRNNVHVLVFKFNEK